jgi:hypothetical protein
MMYRVIVILSGALALAACSSSSTPDWMKTPDLSGMNALKSTPMLDTVRFESEPPGATAKTSNGQTCRTPCALALPVNAPLTVTFSLNGYEPDTEKIELIASNTTLDDAPSHPQLQPNPVFAELTPAPPTKPAAAKKPPAKQTSAVRPAAKPATRPTPAAATAAAPPPMIAAPPPQQAPAPWPSTPPPQR